METLIIREMEPSLVEELKKAAEHHDMDHFFGTWSEEEFHQIQGKIDSERKIDRELWE